MQSQKEIYDFWGLNVVDDIHKSLNKFFVFLKVKRALKVSLKLYFKFSYSTLIIFCNSHTYI